MQKLIVIRGHSGSGKSTFAQHKIAEFRQQFPQSEVFHIENDQFLYENEEYIWTETRFVLAKQKSAEKLQKGWNFAKSHPNHPVLIINSNVNVNKQAAETWQKIANTLNMQVEIYRLMNFFPNRHKVSQETVKSMFDALNQNPIEGEIFILDHKKDIL